MSEQMENKNAILYSTEEHRDLVFRKMKQIESRWIKIVEDFFSKGEKLDVLIIGWIDKHVPILTDR
ncbi:MAG: hypothetical protein JW776_14745 [Candidatus Lokiarchaeota archaeon]|nr:hypothetical protein [Candidatus Lokiarchaeota archaeon]